MYLYQDLHPKFSFVCFIYCISAIIESLSEPYIAKNILNFNYSIYAKAEGNALFIKTILLYFLFQINWFDPLVNFGVC